MPDDRLTQVTWIARVLGVAVPLGEAAEPNFDFTTELHDRLAEVLGMVRTLADHDAAGRIVASGQQAKAAIDANQLADASLTLDVMEAALAEAMRAAFMATVGERGGPSGGIRQAAAGPRARRRKRRRANAFLRSPPPS